MQLAQFGKLNIGDGIGDSKVVNTLRAAHLIHL